MFNKINKIFLILIIVLLLSACSSEDRERKQFLKEAKEIVSMIENRMANKEQLSEDEDHKFLMFISKYAGEDQTDEKVRVATLIAYLNGMRSFYINESNSVKKLDYIDSYQETLTKLQQELE